MLELIRESFAIHNLGVTAFLILIVLYWISVILGALEIDSFDVDLDVEADIDLEGNHDVDAGTDGGGAFAAFLKFLNADGVPLMIILSFLALFMWVGSVLSNWHFNGVPSDRSLGMALAMLAPIFLVSCIATKIVTLPLKGLLKKLNWQGENHQPVVGRTGLVKTSEVTEKFGQVEVVDDDSPTVINVRVSPGSDAIARGSEVIIISHDADRNVYLIRPNR